MRSILAAVLAFVLLFPLSAEGQIETKSSEITGSTRLASTDMRVLYSETYPGRARFRAACEMTETDTTWQVSIYGFVGETSDLSATSDVRVQADGRSVPVQSVRSSRRTINDKILEIKHVVFRRSDFERVATAEKVFATVGPYRFEFSRVLRKDLRLILERVPAQKGPRTASSDSSGSGQ